MPNSSRDTILASIQNSLQASRPGNSSPTLEIDRSYQRTGILDRQACLQLFTERLREYDATVTFTEGNTLRKTIQQIVTTESSSTGSPWVVADGFPSDWLPADGSFLWEQNATGDDLNKCSGVISTCSVGIAITGTIVVQHGPGEGKRQTSLLPDRHLCVMKTSQVVETVPQAFDLLASAATRPLTFISGPSATADIEMTRIRGVHGPRQLDVVLIGT